MHFEKLQVWRRSKDLCVDVYRALSGCRDYGFRDQITGSALSISSNIAEGMGHQSRKEKVRYLNIAKASTSEFKSQTYIAAEIDYVSQEQGIHWLRESEEIAKMLHSLSQSLKP